MTNRKSVFLLLIVMLSVLCACKKNENIPGPSSSNSFNGGGGGNTNPNLGFFVMNTTPSQSFVINVTDGTDSITGARGTRVSIPRKSFLLQGQPYTGNIRLELKELVDQNEMILSNKTTVAAGNKPLISGGEIFINATTIDGQQLQVRDSSFFLIKIPIDSAFQSGMTSFSGLNDTSGNVNWTQSNPDTAKAFTGDLHAFDSTWFVNNSPLFYYTSTQYIFTINKLGWTSCDKYWKIPSKINIAVTCNSPCSISNTKVFVTFRKVKSAAPCYHNGTAFMANGVPAGYTATIVALGYKDGKEYFSVKDTSASTNVNITLTLVQSSQDSIKNILTLKFK